MRQVKRCAQWMAASLAFSACAAAIGAPDPATRAVRPTSRPAAAQPATVPAKISLNFKDVPLDTVLDSLSQTLGFEVVKDGAVDSRVTLMSKQPVSPEEAVTMLMAALKGNNLSVIREGRLLRVIPWDKAKKGNVPVHFGSNPEDIADSDEIITQVIPVQNVNAGKLKEDLKPLVGPPEAEVTSNEGSNSIIITGTSSHIRRIVQIIARLDEREAQTSEIRIIQLKHANAPAAAKLIETFFKPPAGGGPQMQPGMPMPQPQPGQPGGAGHGSERHGQSVVTAADERTNTLLVMASSGTLKVIEDIVQRIDADQSAAVPTTETRAFQLHYAEAESTAKLINDVYKAPQDNSFPFFIRFGGSEEKKEKINAAFDTRTNTVVVTGPSEALAGVQQLIEKLDANPVVSAELKVYRLKFGDAFTVAKLLEDIVKPKDDSSNRFPFFIFLDGPSPQQAKGIKISITYDDRTNSVIVSAPSEAQKTIAKLIQDLDADPSTEDTLFIYHLRNAQASDLEYTLNVLFGNISNNGQPNPQQGQPGQPGQSRNQNNNAFGNNGNGFGNDNAFGGNRRNNNNQNRRNRNGMQGQQNIASTFNELTGKVLVVAEPDTNALLVTTASRYEKQVRRIIDDLDRPVPQVLIKVLVAEVTHDNSADFGVDFSILNQRPSGKGLQVGQTLGNAGSYVANGGLAVSLLESNLQATLHALAIANKLDILSRPYILASDNQEATISVGQNVPIVSDIRVTETGQLIAVPQYKQIGITLDVTPHINPDGLVILDVAPSIIQLTSSNVQIIPGVTSPIFDQRQAESRVAIRDGQTIVIGGLMEDRKTSTINKVPILGDIPLLGVVFSRTQVAKTKTELLLFLTPHVALLPDALHPMSRDELNGTRLTPNAVEPGTFQDHMKGMQRGNVPTTQSTQPSSPVNQIDLSEPPDPRPSGRNSPGALSPTTHDEHANVK